VNSWPAGSGARPNDSSRCPGDSSASGNGDD
jgi:hypothetical protein